MDNALLYSKLATLPESMKSEVLDFIDFLINKEKKNKIDSDRPRPKFGSGKGTFKMNTDFDEPLADFRDYMN
ncbi:MAG TPA: DUF2281 domain-containing protein [Hanamia sp.]|nr:DUF2281 domain-containing protein [Hanamia sp.]